MKICKHFSGVLALVFLLTFCSCSSTQLSAGGKKKPKWVRERPVSNEYYIGIGMANKSGDNYIKVAKDNALTDLISEISVKISSNSVLRQFENNVGFREEFESYTKTKVKDEIEDFEHVDSYEGKDNYWVYYRLSKEKYARMKREKLEKAKNLAKDFYEKAKKAEEKLDLHNALNYYVKSFEAVKKHLDEDLSVFTLEGRINLGNAIYQNIQEIFSSINIEPGQELYEIKALSSNKTPVKAFVTYKKNGNQQPVNNLPVVFSFPELDIDKTESVNSNAAGELVCSIAEMAPKGERQKIKATLNTEVYFGEEKRTLLKEMFKNVSNVPHGYIVVNVSDLKAYFEATETQFGKNMPSKPIAKLFKKELSEDFFSFVDDKDNADVHIKVDANIIKGKKMDRFNLHTAYANCNISLANAKTNAEIYSTGLNNIKGMKTGSFSMAAQDARKKVEEQIRNQIIPDIRKINF